jgi:hypothetical protein
MTRLTLLLMALGLTGCPQPSKDTADTDIGTDSDTDDTADTDTHGTCDAAVLSTTPANGATAVYYRDGIEVSFDDDGSLAAITLVDADGAEVPFTTTWTEGNVQAQLTTVLEANTTYLLSVDVCSVITTAEFTTSSVGEPLAVSPSDLIGRTYVFRLSDAEITDPAFLEFVAATYLTVPLLIAVTASDDTTLDLIGGIGEAENDGTFSQVLTEETWDFPAGDFSQQPYFEASAAYITLGYDGIPIPIEGFHLSGTFSADGTSIEKGVASGMGDSRYMGPLLGRDADDYGAVCEIAAGAGITCEPCSDGEPYCLNIVAEEVNAVWEDGLVMEEVVIP